MFKIIKAHLKKQWLSFVTVIVFIMIAGMMLSVGITLSMNAKSFYTEKAEAANQANYEIWVGKDYTKNDFWSRLALSLIINEPKIDDYEVTKNIVINSNGMGFGTRPLNDGMRLSVPNIKAEITGISNPVYLNTACKMRFGYNIGDKMILESPNIKKEYIVAGFYEELTTMYSSLAYLPEKDFNYYAADIDEFLKANPDNYDYYYEDYIKIKSSDPDFYNSFMKKLSDKYLPLFAMAGVEFNFGIMTQTFVTDNILSFASILSVVLIVFSFIIIGVCLIIMRFSIVSFIEDDIKNSGILKGLGYRDKELRLIMLCEYLIAASIASMVGMLLSLAVTPLFSSVIGKTVDLIWSAIPGAAALIPALFAPILISVFFVWFVSRKLNKITPLHALRQGIEIHSFKKNFLPLDKFDKCTNVVVSSKGILNHLKRYLSVALVICVISLVSVFALMMHYNLNVSNAAFAGITGAETADAMVRNKVIPDEILENMPEIDRISYSGYGSSVNMSHNANKLYFVKIMTVKDFSLSSINTLYKGKYPINFNEILISKNVSDSLGVGIGDVITVNFNKRLTEFKVTGLCQNMSSPECAYISHDAIEYMYDLDMENYSYYDAYIFLKPGVDYDAFYAKLSSMISEEDIYSLEGRETVPNVYISPSIKDGAKLLTAAMDIIATICVAMVLMFILRLNILRERRNIAINKALGATTKDIIIQMTFGLVLIIGIFSLIGAILGALLSGVILQLALASFSIMSLKLIAPWGIIIAMVAVITLFAMGISILIALRTKNISPRSLISM